MLIDQPNKIKKTTVTYRVNPEILNEFRTLCKEHNYKQIVIIENAMKKAIEELKGLGDDK
jgi:hypothetical protein